MADAQATGSATPRSGLVTAHLPALLAAALTALLLLVPVDGPLTAAAGLGWDWMPSWLESQVSRGDGGVADKLFHGALFFALTVLVHRSLSRLSVRFRRAPIGSALVTTAYGLVLELLQVSLAARSAEFADGLANAAGALLSVACLRLWNAAMKGLS